MFNISQKAFGLGDAIVGLYAIEAIKQKYPNRQINYYTRFNNWIKQQSVGVNLKNIGDAEKVDTINLQGDYDNELLYATDRKQQYCDRIEIGLTPTIPKLDNSFFKDIKTSIRNDNYIIIAPFATTAPRTQPLGNQHYLIDLIRENTDLEVILLDSAGDGKRHQNFNCFRYQGHPPEVVLNLLYYSKGLIVNDSGLAHMGGLLDIPTYAIHTQFKPEHLFSYTNIKSIYKDMDCAGCKFINGFKQGCNMGCYVLNSITPIEVFENIYTIKK